MAQMIPESTWQHTMAVHGSALAQSTRNNYARTRERFLQWAAAERVAPQARTLPIPEPVLCAFAASFAGAYAGGTARSAFSALKYWHEEQGVPWSGSPRLARILDAVVLQAPAEATKPERPPVTLAMIDEALVHLVPDSNFDQCVAAAMLVAFWGQFRLGEIISDTRRYDFEKLPVRKHVKLRRDAGGDPHRETSAIWLPRTKTARRGEWVFLSKHHNDPSYALQEHLKDNNIGREDPLFAYRNDAGELIPLTKRAFLGRLNEIWHKAGMQTVSGHCFRIGGTTALLRLGVDPSVVKTAGRWKSDAFHRYWRSVESIIAAHTDLCDITWSG